LQSTPCRTQGLRVIDLNRPHALNALNGEMVATLLPLVRDWQRPGGDVKLAVLRGNGGRAFCAGGDVRALHACAAGLQGGTLALAHAFFRQEYALNYALATSVVAFASILGVL
jgi:enoyl-CoA hydratase/carnithine racemase